MMNNDWFTRFRKPLTAGACLLTLAMGVPAFAAERTGGITWRGNVDDVTRIVIRGRSVSSYAVSGRSPYDVSYRSNGDLPNGNTDVRLQNVRGRGEVRVIQEPSRGNGFATIVEVRDRQGGAAPYEFRLFWQSDDDRGGWGRNDRWDNDNRRDNDRRDNDRWGNGRWDRNRRDNDNDEWSRDERAAYQIGYDLGRQDRSRRLSRDVNRYRNRYNNRTEDEFRRGYNNGYDGARFPGRG